MKARSTKRSIQRKRLDLAVDPQTSARLGRVRQKDTSAEITVRRIVHQLGFRFRIRNRDLSGSPDLANRVKRWAIFVHGCFWHAHHGCYRATVPKRNHAFWVAKFRDNRRRDERVLQRLRGLGFVPTVVWECWLDDMPSLRRRLASFLRRIDSRSRR